MSSTGFYLFLLLHKKPLRHFIESVNALNGLLLISSQNICNLNRILCVSMPSTGFYLFLLLINQIPFWLSCVNALNGLLLISSLGWMENAEDYKYVSMPSTGFYLFLQISKENETWLKKRVNALNGLLLISSTLAPYSAIIARVLCQCPQRASTYFFPRLWIGSA